eukprot:1661040-Amphidinium_carterae.1
MKLAAKGFIKFVYMPAWIVVKSIPQSILDYDFHVIHSVPKMRRQIWSQDKTEFACCTFTFFCTVFLICCFLRLLDAGHSLPTLLLSWVGVVFILSADASSQASRLNVSCIARNNSFKTNFH